MKKISLLMGATLAFFFMATPHVYAKKKYAPEGSATLAIQQLDDRLDAYILRPKTNAEKKFNRDLKKEILQGTFDLRELSRLALARHWEDLSRSKKNNFVELLTELLERKAIFSKENASTKSSKSVYHITYESENFLKKTKDLALVHTLVHIPSEELSIGLDYKLKRDKNEWKIYDVIVDDASLVDNYRYQFDRIISQHGFDDLVHRMRSKLTELQQKDAPQKLERAPTPTPPATTKKVFGCTLKT